MKKVLIITGCLLVAAAVSILVKELIERDQYPLAELDRKTLKNHYEEFSVHKGTHPKMTYINKQQLGQSNKVIACFLRDDKPAVVRISGNENGRYRINQSGWGGFPTHQESIKANGDWYLVICGVNPDARIAKIKAVDEATGDKLEFSAPKEEYFMITEKLQVGKSLSKYDEPYYLTQYFDEEGKDITAKWEK